MRPFVPSPRMRRRFHAPPGTRVLIAVLSGFTWPPIRAIANSTPQRALIQFPLDA